MFQKSVHVVGLPIVFIVSVALLFGFFCAAGMLYMPSMHMNTTSTVAMVIQSERSCCGMAVSAHVELWKGILLALPHETQHLLPALVFLLAVSLAIVYVLHRSIASSKILLCIVYARRYGGMRIFNYLTLAFARGVLHPKLY